MVEAISPIPPRVGLRVGPRIVPAIPMVLSGDEASLLLCTQAPPSERIQMVLDWSDGSVTELEGRVRALEEGGLIAHVDVEEVSANWRPFLDYLGQQALTWL